MGRMSELAAELAELGHDDYGSPEPDLLEMLAVDAQMAVDRYQRELAKREAEKGKTQ